jgi:hypothetical protein
MVSAHHRGEPTEEGNTMRFMSLLRADESCFDGTPPAVFQAMGEFAREGFTNGTLVEMGGLGPSSLGAIVSLVDGTITAVDGPFTETKELIGGYAVIDVHSRQEAVELGRRLLEIHRDNWPGWEGSCEIRQLFNEPPA